MHLIHRAKLGGRLFNCSTTTKAATISTSFLMTTCHTTLETFFFIYFCNRSRVVTRARGEGQRVAHTNLTFICCITDI